MDKEWILFQLKERIETLKHRYRMLVTDKNDDGRPITKKAATVARSLCKKDMNICMLVEELMVTQPAILNMSDEAIEAVERLIEPNERHRKHE